MAKTNLPTAKHHCTLSFDGTPIVSFASRLGCIDTPGTIPWELVRDLFPGKHMGFGSDYAVTEEVSPHVFRQTARVTFIEGRKIAANHTDYANPESKTDYVWEAYQDYNR